MTELEKLTKEKNETQDKINIIEAEITQGQSLLWSKKALVKSYQKHLLLVDATIKSIG
jgi:hypothetical protein